MYWIPSRTGCFLAFVENGNGVKKRTTKAVVLNKINDQTFLFLNVKFFYLRAKASTEAWVVT